MLICTTFRLVANFASRDHSTLDWSSTNVNCLIVGKVKPFGHVRSWRAGRVLPVGTPLSCNLYPAIDIRGRVCCGKVGGRCPKAPSRTRSGGGLGGGGLDPWATMPPPIHPLRG